MSDCFIGEIRMFGGPYAPRDWAFCDGQLLSINDNAALYSLLGTTYGGDGRNTFALPDLRGRIPIHQGNGPGLANYTIGAHGGAEYISLTDDQMPAHVHGLWALTDAADTTDPSSRMLAQPAFFPYKSATPNAQMKTGAIGSSGSSQPHTNLMPYQCVNFIIALVGEYPPRS